MSIFIKRVTGGLPVTFYINKTDSLIDDICRWAGDHSAFFMEYNWIIKIHIH